MDRATKILLVAVATGLWANASVSTLSPAAAQKRSPDPLSYLDQQNLADSIRNDILLLERIPVMLQHTRNGRRS